MKPETMKACGHSLSLCYKMVAGLESMRNKEATVNELHKNDRDNVRSKLEMSIDVFDFNHHPETDLINTATETISAPNVNVEKSYDLGRKKLQKFESSLPGGYHNIISRI